MILSLVLLLGENVRDGRLARDDFSDDISNLKELVESDKGKGFSLAMNKEIIRVVRYDLDEEKVRRSSWS